LCVDSLFIEGLAMGGERERGATIGE